jgi:hypothetical protein
MITRFLKRNKSHRKARSHLGDTKKEDEPQVLGSSKLIIPKPHTPKHHG